MTALELATLEAGRVFHDIAFGCSLQRYHPGRRAGGMHDTPADGLAMLEVNHAPAITRTFLVLEMHRLAEEAVDTSAASEYLEWVGKALRATQRLAQFLWQPIPVGVRTQVIDEDDLGPTVSSYLPGSRHDEFGPVLVFDELNQEAPRAAWREVSKQARATPSYAAAREAALRAEREPLRGELARHRQQVVAALDDVLSQGPITIGDAHARQREIVEHAYDEVGADLRQLAIVIRRYNALVNHVLWAVLGMAERTEDLVRFERGLGTVRIERGAHAPEVTITTNELDGWIGHPPSPYLIDAAMPLDGLYLSTNTMMQWEVDALIDVSGSRLGDLEADSGGSFQRR